MNSAEIVKLQKLIGTEADGFWGNKSIAACQQHLLKLMPTKNPWPNSSQNSLQAFYGSPGDESRLTLLDVSDLDVRYEGQHAKYIRCHTKVSASLRRILELIKSSSHSALLHAYDGCFNNRPMRGGTTPSLHARGAAIDFDAANNANLSHWPTNASMPLEIMEIFATIVTGKQIGRAHV